MRDRQSRLSIRIRPGNIRHHLWNNNGTWWCHYTLHRPDCTKHRVRISLQTPRLSRALRRRDAILAGIPGGRKGDGPQPMSRAARASRNRCSVPQ